MSNDETPPTISGMMRSLSGRSRTKASSWRRWVYETIEVGPPDNALSRYFDASVVILIVLNIAAFVAETVPSIEFRYRREFEIFEWVSIVLFTTEYALRLWTAVEVPFLARKKPWRARLSFAARPYMIIDLLAILPFYLSLILPIDLRALRVLRLIRFFKLSRYSPAIHTLLRVLSNERRSLTGAGVLLVAAVLMSSTVMYYIEGDVQPDKFGSVPLAAYWAVTTLTTVGYGDVTPVTAAGKVWAGITMIFGLCILALPVAIVSTGFAQEAGRRDFVVTWSLMSRIPMLADLEAQDVAQIMPLLQANHIPPSTEIIGEGAAAEAMYFIASGAVDHHDESGVTRMSPGEFFGVSDMLERSANSGAYRTVGRTRLLKLHRADFHRLEQINPALGRHIRLVAASKHRTGHHEPVPS